MLPFLVTLKKQLKLKPTQNIILKRILKTPPKTSTKLIHELNNTTPLIDRMKELSIKYVSNARINRNKNITNHLANSKPHNT